MPDNIVTQASRALAGCGGCLVAVGCAILSAMICSGMLILFV